MDAETIRKMPLDYFIEWMLQADRYSVDVTTGVVINKRTARALRAFPNAAGYPSVNLVFSRAVVRRVTVHRMIAVLRWGASAIEELDIAHLDHNRSRSVLSNLQPMTAADHNIYDGTIANLTHGRVKASWRPCVRCGDENGCITGANRTPDRISGQRFGIHGAICRRCYGTLQERERRKHAAPPKQCHGDVLARVAEEE